MSRLAYAVRIHGMKGPIMMEVNQSRHWTCRLLMEGENGAKRRMQRITASQSSPLPERNNLPARKSAHRASPWYYPQEGSVVEVK